MTGFPDGWITQTLRDWGMQAQSGFASGAHNSEGTGVIHLRPMNVSRLGKLDFDSFKSVEDESNRRIQKGDILFNNTNSAELVGKTALVDIEGDFAFSNHMTRLRFPAEKVLHEYMAILLHSFWMSGYFNQICSNHVNQASISIKRLEQVEVSLPPIGEQRKIVALLEDHLSRLDAAIADVKQAKTKAAQFRMSVLHSVFNAANSTADWDSTTLEKIGVWKTGSTPISKNPEFQGTDVKFVTPGDIGFGGKLSSVARTISNEGADSVRRVTPPSVHLVCIGTIGKVAWTNEIVTTNQQINSLEVDASENNPEFLMWLIASPEIQEKLWANSSSTTVPILNKGKLEKIACTIPSLETQDEVMKFIDISFAKLDAILKTLHLLENHSSILRRSLLQAAFTGQLTKEVVDV
jgi:restriction endonuclease S subunit